MPSLYDILDISPGASMDTVESAYQQQIQETAPSETDTLARVEIAYFILGNANRRTEYDTADSFEKFLRRHNLYTPFITGELSGHSEVDIPDKAQAATRSDATRARERLKRDISDQDIDYGDEDMIAQMSHADGYTYGTSPSETNQSQSQTSNPDRAGHPTADAKTSPSDTDGNSSSGSTSSFDDEQREPYPTVIGSLLTGNETFGIAVMAIGLVLGITTAQLLNLPLPYVVTALVIIVLLSDIIRFVRRILKT